jgi:DNA repair exonuclease SbcCD ATPase subunit
MTRSLTQLQSEFDSLKANSIMTQNRNATQLEDDARNARYYYDQAVASYNAVNTTLTTKRTELSNAQNNEASARQEMNQSRTEAEAASGQYNRLVQEANTLKQNLLEDYIAAALEDAVDRAHDPMEELIVRLSGLNSEVDHEIT